MALVGTTEPIVIPSGHNEKPADPTPRPKVVAGGLAGATVTIILFVLASADIHLPAEVGTALVTVVAFLISYVTSDH